MSQQRSFSKRCGSCGVMVTIVYAQKERVYAWETSEWVWPEAKSFICPSCGRRLSDGTYPLSYYARILLDEVEQEVSQKASPPNQSAQ